MHDKRPVGTRKREEEGIEGTGEEVSLSRSRDGEGLVTAQK